MSATVGDYLFWRLSTIGVRQVIGRGPNSLFIGSIQRNNLTHVDSTRSHVSPSSSEVGAYVVSTTAGDLAACFEEGRRLYAWRPVVFIGEMESAQFTNASDVTSGLSFAAATVLNSPTTAASQISRILDVMMYESKPVYVGLSLAVAGQIMSISQPTATSGSYAISAGSGQYQTSADASVAMSFIR